MPVTPHGVPAFTIRPPCTIHDDGAPTDSLRRDADRVFLLIEDERHLTAEALLASVQERVAAALIEPGGLSSLTLHKPKKSMFHGKRDKKEATDALEKKTAEVQQLKNFLASKSAVIHTLEVSDRRSTGICCRCCCCGTMSFESTAFH